MLPDKRLTLKTSILPRFIELFDKYATDGEKELKLKRPCQMQDVLEVTRELLVTSDEDNDDVLYENVEKLRVLKSVLEMLVVHLVPCPPCLLVKGSSPQKLKN